jgi:PTH1 family peptidyl-tRNA hydrolase
MKLIVGLGNPEDKYQKNRHNVGFMLIDELASNFGGEFKNSLSFKSLVLKTDNFILGKPLTFMNDSGIAVRKLVDSYQIDLNSLFVAYDDLDIPLGSYKIVFGKPPKTHNGIFSVIGSLKTSKFWHIRIGVENRDKENRIPGEKYVLEDFLDSEIEVVRGVLKEVKDDILTGI